MVGPHHDQPPAFARGDRREGGFELLADVDALGRAPFAARRTARRRCGRGLRRACGRRSRRCRRRPSRRRRVRRFRSWGRRSSRPGRSRPARPRRTAAAAQRQSSSAQRTEHRARLTCRDADRPVNELRLRTKHSLRVHQFFSKLNTSCSRWCASGLDTPERPGLRPARGRTHLRITSKGASHVRPTAPAPSCWPDRRTRAGRPRRPPGARALLLERLDLDLPADDPARRRLPQGDPPAHPEGRAGDLRRRHRRSRGRAKSTSATSRATRSSASTRTASCSRRSPATACA